MPKVRVVGSREIESVPEPGQKQRRRIRYPLSWDLPSGIPSWCSLTWITRTKTLVLSWPSTVDGHQVLEQVPRSLVGLRGAPAPTPETKYLWPIVDTTGRCQFGKPLSKHSTSFHPDFTAIGLRVCQACVKWALTRDNALALEAMVDYYSLHYGPDAMVTLEPPLPTQTLFRLSRRLLAGSWAPILDILYRGSSWETEPDLLVELWYLCKGKITVLEKDGVPQGLTDLPPKRRKPADAKDLTALVLPHPTLTVYQSDTYIHGNAVLANLVGDSTRVGILHPARGPLLETAGPGMPSDTRIGCIADPSMYEADTDIYLIYHAHFCTAEEWTVVLTAIPAGTSIVALVNPKIKVAAAVSIIPYVGIRLFPLPVAPIQDPSWTDWLENRLSSNGLESDALLVQLSIVPPELLVLFAVLNLKIHFHLYLPAP